MIIGVFCRSATSLMTKTPYIDNGIDLDLEFETTDEIPVPHRLLDQVIGQDAAVELIKKAGYFVEDDSYSPNTVVVEFPVHEQHFERSKNDVSIWEQAEDRILSTYKRNMTGQKNEETASQ